MKSRFIVKLSLLAILIISLIGIENSTSLQAMDGEEIENKSIELNDDESEAPEVLRIPRHEYFDPYAYPIDPWLVVDLTGNAMHSLVYSQLIDYDYDLRKYVPKLATDWYADFGGSVWTFILRDEVIFHDGSKFNSSSILNEINRGKQLREIGKIEDLHILSELIDLIDNVTIHSEYQLSFYLTKQFSPFLSSLVDLYFVAPAASVGTTVVDRIGTGPYIFNEEISTSFREVYYKNDLYFEGVPPFQTVEILDYDDQSSAFKDDLLDLLPIFYEDFDSEDIKYIIRNDTWVNMMGIFNTNNLILSNSKVRQALNYAVDHATINNRLFKPLLGDAFHEFTNQNYSVFPFSSSNTPIAENQFNFDLVIAAELLDEAGYALNSNNFRFNITIVSRGDGFHPTILEPVIQAFENLGIGVIWEADTDTWLNKFTNRNYDIWVGGFPAGSVDISDILLTDGHYNNGYYFNQKLNSLFNSVFETAITNEQYYHYSQIADLIKDEAPILQLDSWGAIHPIKAHVFDFVTLGYHYRLIFNYSDETHDDRVDTNFNVDRSNVYSPRLEIAVIKDSNQDFEIQKANNISEFNRKWDVKGKEVSGVHVAQIENESPFTMIIYFDPRETNVVDSITLYSLENDKFNEVKITRNKNFSSIKFEGSGDLYLSVGIGALSVQVSSENDFPFGKFSVLEVELVVTLFISIVIILGFALDYVRNHMGRYDSFSYNLHRYSLFLPEKAKIGLSLLSGILLTGGLFATDWVLSTLGILGLQDKGQQSNTDNRPKVVADGEIIDPGKFSSNKLPKIKGRTLDLYYYIINNPGFHGVREIQRELNYSAPSVVYYHLNRMIKANIIKKNKEGKYGLPLILTSQSLLRKDQFDYFNRIIPRTFMLGISFITSFFSLIIISFFVPSFRSWLILAPLLLFLAIFQFREGFNLLWDLRTVDQSTDQKGKSSYDNLQQKIVKAIALKKSSRGKDLFEAQKILEDVLQEDKLGNELTIIALFNLCGILVDELQIKQEEEILFEAERLTERIIDLSITLETKTMSVEALFIKSKFHVIRGLFDDAVECLVKAEEIAEGDTILETKVKREYQNLNNEISRLQKFGSSISLSDKVEKMKVQEYLNQILKNIDLTNLQN